MDLHDHSRFHCDWDKALSPLLFSYKVDDIQCCLKNLDEPVLDNHLRECLEIKSHNAGSDLLLFSLESQNSSIYQDLLLVLEDIAFAGRVMHNPMKEIVIWIICTPHFI